MMAVLSVPRAVRLGYLVSHPVQYQAPLLRRLAQEQGIDFKVYFLSGMSTGQYFDTGFGRSIEWDIPLLDGYKHEFLTPLGATGEPSRFGNLPVEKALARDRIQVLWHHGWGYFTNLRALWHARSLGIKTLMRGESNLLPRLPGATNRLKENAKDAFLRWCFSRIDAFLCIGRLNREFYRHYGIADARLFDVPYAVDNEFFHQRLRAARENRESFRASLGLDPRRPVILYAGKLVAFKAPGDLLEAYKRLSSDGAAEPAPYLLFAGDGAEREALEQAARKTGWNSIRFLGFRNQTELPALFDLCDVFAMPSRWEPWGLVVNEVMNAAKPIVISDGAGCAPDLVRHGVNGLVFPAGDVGALSESLKRVISSDELRTQLGRNSADMISRWSFREDLAGILNAVDRVMS